MITPERVCKILEGMYLLDFHEQEGFADKVYMWCHIARDTCKNKHEDWQAEFLEAEKAVLDAMKAPSEKDCSLFYDPEFGDDRICECDHSYYRHFDSYDNMRPVGCKYCQCYKFKEQSNENNQGSK
jgi:hypothetical protein